MKQNRLLFIAIILIPLLGITRWWVTNQFTTEELNEKHVARVITDQVYDQEYKIVPVLDSLSLYGTIGKLNAKQEPYPFFVFLNGNLHYWSDYHFVPEYTDVSGASKYMYIDKPFGKFIVRRWVVVHEQTTYEVFSLIPLTRGYLINNLFIHSSINPKIATDGMVDIDAPYEGDGYKVVINGVDVCRIRLKQEYLPAVITPIKIIDSLLVIACILLFVTTYIRVIKSHNYWEAPLFLFGWAFFKWGLPLLAGVSSMADVNLFDPQYYAVSWFERSFGDLLINTVFILITSIRAESWLRNRSFTKWISGANSDVRKVAIAVLLAFFTFWVLNYPFFQLRSIYHNSQLSIDITSSLQIDQLRFLTFVVVILINVSTFFLYHSIIRHLIRIAPNIKSFAFSMLVGALLFVALSFIANMPIANLVLINTVLATGLWYLKLPSSLSAATYKRFLYIILFFAIVSAITGKLVSEFETQRKTARTASLLDKKLSVSDPFAEFLLSSAMSDLSTDPFIVSRMASPFLSKSAVISKVKQVFLNSYLNKFEQDVYLFDPKGNPLEISGYNRSIFARLNELDPRASKTDYPSVFYANENSSGFTKHYIGYGSIKRSNIVVGYVLVELVEKQFSTPGVYPELLVDNRFQTSNAQEIDFAYYKNGKLLNTVSGGEYPSKFDMPGSNVWYDGETVYVSLQQRGRAIIAGVPFDKQGIMISNTSFIWVITIAPLVLIWLLIFLVRHKGFGSLSYTERILWYLNIAFIVPLLLVTSVTFRLLTDSFEKESNADKLATVERVAEQLNQEVSEYTQDDNRLEELTERLNTLSDNTQSDFNLFDINGQLIASSQPGVFNKYLLAPYINPEALINIKEKGASHFVLKEKVGNLQFNGSYAAVISEGNGALLGIVSMPFFSSDSSLQSSKLEAFTTILNVFVVVLMATLLATYFAGKWLTKPLVMIRNKLRSTSFSKHTEPINIQWSDELGMLIRAYNQMLVDLEESKGALQRSEKEKAWREAAQQVAHEIKNPLTPMKLTLQRIHNKVLKGEINTHELETPLKSVLDQVETLNSIASSFSEFAKMPTPAVERVEVHAIIRKAAELFSGDSTLNIKLQLADHEVYSNVDPKLLSRILNNLFINAKQSARPEQQHINVVLETQLEGNLIIRIQDDGSGIDPVIADKVFIPKFTTKEQGSGIGLAMTKYGVENMGGKIYFESELGVGTQFTLELPIVD